MKVRLTKLTLNLKSTDLIDLPENTEFLLTMSAGFTPVSEVVPEKLNVAQTPQTRALPGGKQGTQTRAWYSYAHAEGRSGDAMFELKICKGSIGKAVDEQTGNVTWKLNLRNIDPEDLEGCARIDRGRYLNLAKHKVAMKMLNFDPNHPGDIRTISFIPRNDDGSAAGEPMISLKIDDKSQFKAILGIEGDEVNEVDVDFKALIGEELQCSVIFQLWCDYKGSNASTSSPQIYARSCAIINSTSRGRVEHSKSEQLKNFLASATPDQLAGLEAQIAELKKRQAEQPVTLLTPAPPSPAPQQPPPQRQHEVPVGQGGQGMNPMAQQHGNMPPNYGNGANFGSVAQSNLPPMPGLPQVSYGQPGVMGRSMAPDPRIGMDPRMSQMHGQNMDYQNGPMSASRAPLDLTGHLSNNQGGMNYGTSQQPGFQTL